MSPRASLITTALSSLALIAVAAPAVAQTHETRSVEVAYADLDLTTKAGAKRLETRVRFAAKSVCGPNPGRSLAAQQDYKNCVNTAITGGNKAMITVLAQARAGQTLASANQKIIVGN